MEVGLLCSQYSENANVASSDQRRVPARRSIGHNQLLMNTMVDCSIVDLLLQASPGTWLVAGLNFQ